MWSTDVVFFVAIMALTSLLGIWKGKFRKTNQQRRSNDLLVGSGVSTLSVALSVCSSFLSAVSLLGFPAEVYFRGTMILWFVPMYAFAFPVVAYIFLPTLFELKMTSIYEYLERRFSFAHRFVASLLFVIQTLFYMSVALYAPALALSSSMPIPLSFSVILTALLSAVYLFLGGARAGIYTSALQMILIIGCMFTIISASFITWTPYEVWETNANGGRLIFFDFRADPTIRHSFFPVFFGGATTIFSLFAANQLTLQRYMSLPTLKRAQRAVLLNIPMNTCILIMYVVVGLIMFTAFNECHPKITRKDEIFSTFVKDMLFIIPGLEGVFLAAVYSAGLSTLTASYNALTAVTIEDVIKVFLRKKYITWQLTDQNTSSLVKILPFVFASCAAGIAAVIPYFDTMILQISFSIFGAVGGASLAIFCLGLFCPHITSNVAAFVGQITAVLSTFVIVIGSSYHKVRPVDLPLVRDCDTVYYESTTPFNLSNMLVGTVVAENPDTLFSKLSQISYHYYGLVGVFSCFVTSHVIQGIINLIWGKASQHPVDPQLISHWVRLDEKSKNLSKVATDIPLLSCEKNEKASVVTV